MGITNINSKDRKLLLNMKMHACMPKEKLWHESYKKSLKAVNERLKEAQ